MQCSHDHPPVISSPQYTTQQLELAASMFKAMSDPTRLRLLLILQQGERCVSELVELEKSKASSVSARLQLLHAARLLVRRRNAKHVFYALADDHVVQLLNNIFHHASEPHKHEA